MTPLTISRAAMYRNGEDYTHSVCLLLPNGHATLIDSEHFERVVAYEWLVLGRSIFRQTDRGRVRSGRKRTPGMRLIHREVMGIVLQAEIDRQPDSCEQWNMTMEMYRNFERRDIDHRNRNPWDNRADNLRFATRWQNSMNRPGMPGSSSQYKCVSWVEADGLWSVSTTLKGKQYYLGSYKDEVQAALVYNAFVVKHCPEFGYLNPITALPGDEPTSFPKRRRRKKSTN